MKELDNVILERVAYPMKQECFPVDSWGVDPPMKS